MTTLDTSQEGYPPLHPVFSVSDFVALVNQTFELAHSYVEVEGEISSFRVSKNKWVYFDLKDETASLKCFASVYALPGPLEDGMKVRLAGSPRLHPLYNFSFQVRSITPVGEGSLRHAASLLAEKLQKEGLFDEVRKRRLPYPPKRVALVAAGDSAAYVDFIKVSTARWGGLQIMHYNVLVQGQKAPLEIVAVLATINEATITPDVVVLIRGGGSVDDLAAWNDERVVRAIAGSRAPTLAAIGHEVDVVLSELVADRRASTPSNAAELLVPDRKEQIRYIRSYNRLLDERLAGAILLQQSSLAVYAARLDEELASIYRRSRHSVETSHQLLLALDPERPLRQGYALVQKTDGSIVTKAEALHVPDEFLVKFFDGTVLSRVKKVVAIKEKL